MKEQLNTKPKLLDNNSFRKTIYTLLIATTIIVNLDYIQPRDSSKANFPQILSTKILSSSIDL